MIDRKEFEEAKEIQQAYINQERRYKSHAGGLIYIGRNAIPIKEVFRSGISSKLIKGGITTLGDLIDYKGVVSDDIKGIGLIAIQEMRNELKMLGMFINEDKLK